MKWIGRVVDSIAEEAVVTTKPFEIVNDSGATASHNVEYLINDADGGEFLLPTAIQDSEIIVNIGTTITSNQLQIQAPSGQLLLGFAFLANMDSADDAESTYFSPDGSDDRAISLNGGTTGGFIGDRIVLSYFSEGVWKVTAFLSHTGTAATPFL